MVLQAECETECTQFYYHWMSLWLKNADGVSVCAGEVTSGVTFVVSALLSFGLHQESPSYALLYGHFVANIS